MDENTKTEPVDAPFGFHQARVDEKGRLKLPAAVHQYLNGLGEKKVFITTLDELTARVYPIPRWKETEKKLTSAGEDAEDAEALSFLANHYGLEAEVDQQGRMLVPKVLRQKLELEDQSVWLLWQGNRFDMFGEAMYKERLRDAQARKAAALARMKTKGI